MSTNSNQLFTADEQKAAAIELQGRFDQAMAGPTAIGRVTGNIKGLYVAALAYFDTMGPEEKASASAVDQRAALAEMLKQIGADPATLPATSPTIRSTPTWSASPPAKPASCATSPTSPPTPAPRSTRSTRPPAGPSPTIPSSTAARWPPSPSTRTVSSQPPKSAPPRSKCAPARRRALLQSLKTAEQQRPGRLRPERHLALRRHEHRRTHRRGLVRQPLLRQPSPTIRPPANSAPSSVSSPVHLPGAAAPNSSSGSMSLMDYL